MKELTEMAIELMQMETENQIMSVVRGNRNWAIRTETLEDGTKYALVSRFGTMVRRGMMGAMIRTIRQYHIRWYEYTYKKDFEKALTMLENNNYKIIWLQ